MQITNDKTCTKKTKTRLRARMVTRSSKLEVTLRLPIMLIQSSLPPLSHPTKPLYRLMESRSLLRLNISIKIRSSLPVMTPAAHWSPMMATHTMTSTQMIAKSRLSHLVTNSLSLIQTVINSLSQSLPVTNSLSQSHLVTNRISLSNLVTNRISHLVTNRQEAEKVSNSPAMSPTQAPTSPRLTKARTNKAAVAVLKRMISMVKHRLPAMEEANTILISPWSEVTLTPNPAPTQKSLPLPMTKTKQLLFTEERPSLHPCPPLTQKLLS